MNKGTSVSVPIPSFDVSFCRIFAAQGQHRSDDDVGSRDVIHDVNYNITCYSWNKLIASLTTTSLGTIVDHDINYNFITYDVTYNNVTLFITYEVTYLNVTYDVT